MSWEKGYLNKIPNSGHPQETTVLSSITVTLCISISSRLMSMKAGDQLFLFHKELCHMLGCSYTANIELLCLVQIGNLIHSSLHSLRVQRIWSWPKISPSSTANRLRNKTKSPFFFFEVFQFCDYAIRRAQLSNLHWSFHFAGLILVCNPFPIPRK